MAEPQLPKLMMCGLTNLSGTNWNSGVRFLMDDAGPKGGGQDARSNPITGDGNRLNKDLAGVVQWQNLSFPS
jgi:hypothetical protein